MGLGHIHASGLVHRDIKPSNLTLTRDGVVKILDLGLVLSGADPLPSDDRLTTVGHLMGTLAYMAPEQLVDSTTVDHRADLYALGATLYRLLSGAAPHAAARGLAPLVIAKTAKGAPAITDHRSDLPKPLTDLVTRLLDPDPDRRPQAAADVATALEPLAATARPERLVADALRHGATEEESFAPTPLVAPQTAGAKEPPRRRRFAAFAVAAAALPLLLLAGITRRSVPIRRSISTTSSPNTSNTLSGSFPVATKTAMEC